MSILKSIAHFIAASLLVFLTSVGIIAMTAALNLTNRQVVLSWPQEAGTYNQLTDSLTAILEEEGGESLSEALQGSLLEEEGLKKTLASELTPDYWQSIYEDTVNSLYDWLEGTTPNLELSLSFEDKRAPLASALEEEIASQLKDAPVCQTPPIPGVEFDLLSADCLPPGVSPVEAAASFTKQLNESDSPLSKSLLTGEDIQAKMAGAPEGYAAAKTSLWLIPLLMAVLSLAVAFTSKSALHGWRRAGQLLFSTALLTWIGFYLTQRLSQNIQLPNDGSPAQMEVFNNVVTPLAQTIVDSFVTSGLWVSLAVIIAGILVWLGTFFWHKVHHGDEAKAIADRSMKTKQANLPKPVEPKK